MKLNNRFLFGILSILLAAIIAFVALPTISRQTNGKTEIVRVTQPVLKGAAITDKDVEIVEVGSYNLPSNIAVSKEDVVGRYPRAFSELLGWSRVRYSQIDFDCKKVKRLKMFKNNRVDVKFAGKSLANQFAEEYLGQLL